MADQSWAKHVADVLRRNDIRLYATVPDFIVSYVLDELWADPECRVVKVDKRPSTAPFAADIIGQTARFRRALAAL